MKSIERYFEIMPLRYMQKPRPATTKDQASLALKSCQLLALEIKEKTARAINRALKNAILLPRGFFKIFKYLSNSFEYYRWGVT